MLVAAYRGMVARVIASGVGPQFARPTADVTAGGWTPTGAASVSAAVNEVTASDAEYAQVGNTGGATAKLTLGAITNPGGGSTQVIRVRAKTSSGGTVSAALMAAGGGTTYVPSTSMGTLTASFADYTLTLSGAQAASIANYGALELWVTGVADLLNSVSFSHAYFGVS